MQDQSGGSVFPLPAAEAIHKFDVERYTDTPVDFHGWMVVAEDVEGEYERGALLTVLGTDPVPGLYRVIRSDVPFRSFAEFNVSERREWDIERVEWPSND